jgi:hypothetical protein
MFRGNARGLNTGPSIRTPLKLFSSLILRFTKYIRTTKITKIVLNRYRHFIRWSSTLQQSTIK